MPLVTSSSVGDTGGRVRVAAVAAALAVLGLAGAARPAATAPAALVQVTPNELRLSQPFSAAPLAVDGKRAAVAFCNQLVAVWRPGSAGVTRLGPVNQWTCPPPRGLERIYSIAFAGDRVGWAAESGGNQVTGLVFLVVLGNAHALNIAVLTGMCCRPDVDERVGWVHGDDGFLVFASRVKCNDLFQPPCPAGTPRVVISQTVWRLERPPFQGTCVAQPGPCVQLTTLNDVLEPLSVDAGRVVLAHSNGALDVLNTTAGVVRQFPALAGLTRGAELMGGRLVVLVAGRILDLSLASGQQLHARTVPNVPSAGVCGILRCPAATLRLLDAKKGLVAYILSGKLHLLRLKDGRDRVVAAAVDARFGDNGLFYAFTKPGPWPARVKFVRWASLPVRP
jgi:hypothetical protein